MLQVLFTGTFAQLVAICLQAGEEIGNELNQTVDQFFRIEEGEAKFIFGNTEDHLVHEGDPVIVPTGTYHNVTDISKKKPFKLYTVYSPPNHPDCTVHNSKVEAEEAEKSTSTIRNRTPEQP
jgi:mannose-6-phosphate isomerase-like protein (cupin superfamily)